jgi:hypothetical protein
MVRKIQLAKIENKIKWDKDALENKESYSNFWPNGKIKTNIKGSM